jgi:hypothetical protein
MVARYHAWHGNNFLVVPPRPKRTLDSLGGSFFILLGREESLTTSGVLFLIGLGHGCAFEPGAVPNIHG